MSIELSEISDAFRTLIGRRRRLMTFLSTAFAAVGLLLVQVLRGEWPGARVGFSEHAVMLAAAGQGALGMICLVREARIHRLIAFYGVLFARTMVGAQRVSEDEQTASGRLNWLGISALMFYMALGYTVTCVVVVAIGVFGRLWAGSIVGGLSLVAGLRWFRREHNTGVREASQAPSAGRASEEAISKHFNASIEDAQEDMMEMAWVGGATLFAALQIMGALSFLPEVTQREFDAKAVSNVAPALVSWLTALIVMLTCVGYLRLRWGVLWITDRRDPWARVPRALDPNDSLFGALLMGCLLVFSVFLVVVTISPEHLGLAMSIASLMGGLFILADRLLLAVWGGSRKKTPEPSRPETS